jgi:mannose/cellobiose epimerase-like protein (N-acyl-D-glucosamine 2-epimerase family)
MKTLKMSLILAAAVAALGLQSVRADQPHMQNALMHLREARTALQKAEHNKGGHRQRAIERVNQAIAEVEAGMAAAH